MPLTLSVAQSMSGKQVVTCEVAKGTPAVLHTASTSVTSRMSWASNVTPGEELEAGCTTLTRDSVFVYDGSRFLLARNFYCPAP